MKLITIVTSLFLILSVDNCFAQKNLNIGLQTGTFYSSKINGFMLKTFGLYAGYEINNHWEAKITYNKWYDVLNTGPRAPDVIIYANPYFGEWLPGTITTYYNYNFFDLGIYYNAGIKKHTLFVGGGPSYALGKHDVITSVYQHPGYYDILVQSEIVTGRHMGLMYEAGYGYSIFRNHATVGLALSGRKYFNAFAQYSANIQFEYKIPLRKKKNGITPQ